MTAKAKLILWAAPLVLAAPAAAYDQLPDRLARLSPADFAGKVLMSDDPLEPVIILSTEEGYKRSRALQGADADDIHLQALIDRRTGEISWRVWHKLTYQGDRRSITSVHYHADGKLQRSNALTIEHWLDDCPPTDGIGSCNQYTRIGFDLPENIVREIAGSYRPGQRVPWRLRFKDARGRDITGGLAPAEVAGLTQAVAEWRRTRI